MSDRCNELYTEEISSCFDDCEPFDIACIQDCTRLAIQYGKKYGLSEIETKMCLHL